MKCPHCGLNLPDDSEFCQYCGNKLKIETPVPEEIPARRTVRVQPVPSVRPRSVHPAPANPACEPGQTSAVEKCAESAASTSQKSAGQWVVICLVLALLVSLAVNGISVRALSGIGKDGFRAGGYRPVPKTGTDGVQGKSRQLRCIVRVVGTRKHRARLRGLLCQRTHPGGEQRHKRPQVHAGDRGAGDPKY